MLGIVGELRGVIAFRRHIQGRVLIIQVVQGRMRELAVSGASDGANTNDRASIKLEMDQLSSEIPRIADSTEYNDTKVIDGSLYGNVVSATAGDLDDVTNLDVVINQQDRNTLEGAYALTVTATGTGSASGRTLTLKLQHEDYLVVGAAGEGVKEEVEIANADLTVGASDPWTVSQIKVGKTINFSELGITLETDDTTAVEVGSAGTDLKSALVLKVDTGDGAPLQVGADNDSNNQVGFSLKGQTSSHLGIDSMTSSSGADFQGAIDKLDLAIAQINDERGNIGAKQNRLEYTSSNLMNSVQNNAASMSTIGDADFAAEAAELAKNQILTQSGTAMLAQANSLSQNVLSLIR